MEAARRKKTRVQRDDVRGDSHLRDLFTELLAIMSGVAVSRDQVVVTPDGSSLGLAASLVYAMAATNHRTIINFTPSWFGYPQLAEKYRINMRFVPTREENGHLPTAGELEDALTPDVGGVIINNFATPTGGLLDYDRLNELADVLWHHPGVIVVEDGLFLTTRFRGDFPLMLRIAPWLMAEQRYIGTTSLTKGWAPREDTLGFVWTDNETAMSIARAFDPRHPIPKATIRAARGALSNEGLKTPDAVKAGLQANLSELVTLLERLDCGKPVTVPEGGTNVLWDITSLGMHDVMFCHWVLQNTGVDLAAGSRFAAPGHVRVNLGGATPEQFREACTRIYDLLSQIRC